jgi:hypothetical protein
MFRRPRRPGIIRSAVNAAEIDAVQQANQLRAAGRPAESGAAFARLAQEMEAAAHPRRAANLHAQAAHAYADARAEAPALAHAQAALRLFIRFQMLERTHAFYGNITRKLQSCGFTSALNALQSEFAPQAGRQPVEPDETPAAARGRLPAACPQCGGPVRSDEVDWIDANSAECPFCGAVIQTS